MAKDWAKGFYNSALWKAQRRYILKRDHYICTEPGCRQPAEEVHHIIELTEENITNPMIALNESNLRSLCGECHKRITRESMNKQNGILEELFFDEDGYPRAVSELPRGGSHT